MKRWMLLAAVAVAAALPAQEGGAATFSSTQIFNSLQTSAVRVDARINNSSRNYFLQSVQTGVEDVALTVDTVADTGFVSDIDFKPFTGVTRTDTRTVNVNFSVIVTPADFPLPAVTRQVQGQYRDRVTITSITDGTTVDFNSSTTAPITTGSPPFFNLQNNLMLSLGGFTVNGTYEAIGPTQSQTIPFSVAYLPQQPIATRFFQSRITGGATFGDGFGFNAGMGTTTYFPATSLIFNGVIEDVTFRAELDEISVSFLPASEIPEPTSISLGAGGMLAAFVAARQRRG